MVGLSANSAHQAFLLPALAGGLGYGVIIAFNTAAPLDAGAVGRRWITACSAGQSARHALQIALAVNHFVLHRSGVVDDRWRRSELLASQRRRCWAVWRPVPSRYCLAPYCVAVFGQSLNYPISLCANDGADCQVPAMALRRFYPSIDGGDHRHCVIASPQAWPLSLLLHVTAVGVLCVALIRRARVK